MPIPAAFCLFRALLLISLSLAGCVVSTDYTAPTPEQALPHLRAVLKDPNPELRRTAAQSLGKIARKEAVPALMDALCDPDAGVRRHAAWALGMIGEDAVGLDRSEEHTSELQSRLHLVCRLLLEKKKKKAQHKLSCHTQKVT